MHFVLQNIWPVLSLLLFAQNTDVWWESNSEEYGLKIAERKELRGIFGRERGWRTALWFVLFSTLVTKGIKVRWMGRDNTCCKRNKYEGKGVLARSHSRCNDNIKISFSKCGFRDCPPTCLTIVQSVLFLQWMHSGSSGVQFLSQAWLRRHVTISKFDTDASFQLVTAEVQVL